MHPQPGPPGAPFVPHPAAPKQPITGQNLAIAALVCAGLIVVAALMSKSWATWREGGDESGGFGLSGAEFCGEGMCAPVPYELLEGRRVGLPGDVSTWGLLGMIAALAGAAGAGGLGIMILTRKPQNVAKLAKPTLLALGAAGALCAMFVVRILTVSMKIRPGPGWAMFVGLGGLIAAAAVVQRIQRQFAYANPLASAPPGQAPYPAGPPQGYAQYPAAPPAPVQAAPTHPCPRCQRPLVFVAQYQRWFCESCKQYV